MMMIESRPIPEKSFEYRFFVDFEGNLSDAGVRNALTGIAAEASVMRSFRKLLMKDGPVFSGPILIRGGKAMAALHLQPSMWDRLSEMGIYEISNRNRIRKLDHIRHVTALGSDTYNNGKISYEMVEELCDVLAGFAGIMKSYKVTEYRCLCDECDA